MFPDFLKASSEPKDKAAKAAPREGDLFKVIEAHGKRFEIYYGYYDDKDRYSQYNTPVEIYPDFKKNPVYTDLGIPFVTAMQGVCDKFMGDVDEDNTCIECAYYRKCEDLLGICVCYPRREREYNNEKSNRERAHKKLGTEVKK